jgi:hypothetical protein
MRLFGENGSHFADAIGLAWDSHGHFANAGVTGGENDREVRIIVFDLAGEFLPRSVSLLFFRKIEMAWESTEH